MLQQEPLPEYLRERLVVQRRDEAVDILGDAPAELARTEPGLMRQGPEGDPALPKSTPAFNAAARGTAQQQEMFQQNPPRVETPRQEEAHQTNAPSTMFTQTDAPQAGRIQEAMLFTGLPPVGFLHREAQQDNDISVLPVTMPFGSRLYRANFATAMDKYDGTTAERRQQKEDDYDRFTEKALIDSALMQVQENIGLLQDQLQGIREQERQTRDQINTLNQEKTEIEQERAETLSQLKQMKQEKEQANTNEMAAWADFQSAKAQYGPNGPSAMELSKEGQVGDAAYKAHLNDVIATYKSAGLTDPQIKALIDNSDCKRTDEKILAQAKEKALDAGLAVNPEAEFIKYLKKTDPHNPILNSVWAKGIFYEYRRGQADHLNDADHALRVEIATQRLDRENRRLAHVNERLKECQDKLAYLTKQDSQKTLEIERLKTQESRLLDRKQKIESHIQTFDSYSNNNQATKTLFDMQVTKNFTNTWNQKYGGSGRYLSANMLDTQLSNGVESGCFGSDLSCKPFTEQTLTDYFNKNSTNIFGQPAPASFNLADGTTAKTDSKPAPLSPDSHFSGMSASSSLGNGLTAGAAATADFNIASAGVGVGAAVQTPTTPSFLGPEQKQAPLSPQTAFAAPAG